MPPAADNQMLRGVVRRNAIARPSRWIAAKTSATTKVATNCGSAWAGLACRSQRRRRRLHHQHEGQTGS